MEVKKAIVLPDIHGEYEDKRSLKAVEAYMADERWDYWVCLGDLLDFDFISRFNKESLRKVQGRSFKAQYAWGNELLDRHELIVRRRNPEAKMAYLEGNHEFRVEPYIDANPQLVGELEVPVQMSLSERDIEWVPSWSQGATYRIGKAYFHHGLYTIQHHAKKMVTNFGCNIFYGHAHDVQGFSVVTYGDHNVKTGQSLGCLCAYSQDYMRGKPSNWQHAFGVFYFRPNGAFSYYVVRIVNHQFISPEGRVYNG